MKKWILVLLLCTLPCAAQITQPNPVVARATQTAQAANVGTTTLLANAPAGLYRFSCYAVITQAATTSSTLPYCQIAWTDETGAAHTDIPTSSQSTSNTVGTNTSSAAGSYLGPGVFYAGAGHTISWSTGGYASSGATPMQYSVRIILERLN